MAIPSLTNLGKERGVLLLLLLAALLGFIVYIQWFATYEAKLFIGETNIDKIMHFSGGLFLVLAYEWLWFRPLRLRPFVPLFFAITIGWEGFEFFAYEDVRFFYHTFPKLWFLDTLGDIVIAFLAAYGYWVFFRHGPEVGRVTEAEGWVRVEG